MFAHASGPRAAARRRGIVLVLILGMLGLMALIGVTFATFAGQSLRSGRNYAQGVARPQPEALMDYALAQLINDTNNPLSALRGHSLLRDMYGNDSVYRGANPVANTAVELGGLMTQVQLPAGPAPLVLTGYYNKDKTQGGIHAPPLPSGGGYTPFGNRVQYITNIPTGGQYYGLDFTRWVARFGALPGTALALNDGKPSQYATQTFEVLEDDTTHPFHVFTLSAALGTPTQDPAYNNDPKTPVLTSSDHRSFIYNDPNIGANAELANGLNTYYKNYSTFTRDIPGVLDPVTPRANAVDHTDQSFISPNFVLDGRYMRAFNGPGAQAPVKALSTTDAAGNVTYLNYPFNQAAYANFRVAATIPNGYVNFSDPDVAGMDEDYDACDLENWFLALQSADGQVMIPSFHRPGILTANDWSSTAVATQRAKILRPRQADNSPLFPTDPAKPNNDPLSPDYGKLTYDVDNDGDGITDSVWLDLGYPVQRDPTGRLYKPMFAFMVLGLNGRLPLNTVGNLAARATGTSNSTINTIYNANKAATFPVNGSNLADVEQTPGSPQNITPGAVNYPNESGMVPYPGFYAAGTYTQHHPSITSQVFFDTPLYDHASHLGYSVNEINPKFALQNAPSNLYPASAQNYTSVFTTYDTTNYAIGQTYAQYDDAGVPVALTQLRNILAGTRPTDAPNPFPSGPNNPLPPAGYQNGDANSVAMNGQAYILPNNMADGFDANASGGSAIARGTPAVPGRWGEPTGIPQLIPFPAGSTVDPVFPMLTYVNSSRAGQSIVGGSLTSYPATLDSMDDDFDGMDPYLASVLQKNGGGSGYAINGSTSYLNTASSANLPLPFAYNGGGFLRAYPEDVDQFDTLSQRANATERARLFVTPQDTTGIGRTVAFMPRAATDQTRPYGDFDYGLGSDSLGRVGYFRYFRPAGLPQQIFYPYIDQPNSVGGSTFPVPYYAHSAQLSTGQQYLMPLLLPAGQAAANTNANPDNQPGRPVSTFNRMPSPDRTNNATHGLQAALTPQVFTGTPSLLPPTIARLGAMPFDFDPYYQAAPAGYNNQVLDFNQAGGAKTNGTKLMLFSPTIYPGGSSLQTGVNTSSGPNLGPLGDSSNTYGATSFVVPYGSYAAVTPVNDNATPPNPLKVKDANAGTAAAPNTNYNNNTTTNVTLDQATGLVVNGYLGGSLNKDEADEFNPYQPGLHDQPYVNADLEWLYRKQDVDGSSLTSRLSQLAPVSFGNDADALTRRRLFSVDSFDLISFSYANDNPVPYAGVLGNLGIHSADHDFTYNSRFNSLASPSLETMNQITAATTSSTFPFLISGPANAIATEFLPNPTIPTDPNPLTGTAGGTVDGIHLADPVGNTSYPGQTLQGALTANYNGGGNTVLGWPLQIQMAQSTGGTTNNNANIFGYAHYDALADQRTGVVTVDPTTIYSMAQTETPSVAHRDRRINLNYPLPISHDPAEPIRQKWCRETYQFFKAILPPAAVDTPEELAQLSQFVVNIIDFRDPDNAMTRFVNTDLVVTDVLTKQSSPGQRNNNSLGQNGLNGAFDTTWTVSPAGVRFADPANRPATDSLGGHYPFDPSLYSPDTDPTCRFLVQHGMEYCPIAINEAMAYSARYVPKSTSTVTAYSAMFVELVNTLTEAQDNPKASYEVRNTNGTINTTQSTLIANASAVNIEGWDIVIAPDSCGWGRPDPISGDVNSIVVPTYQVPATGADATKPPAIANWVNYAKISGANGAYKDLNWLAQQNMTAQFVIPPNGTQINYGDLSASAKPVDLPCNTYVKAVSGVNYDKFIIGDYRTTVTAPTRAAAGTPGASVVDSASLEQSPVAITTTTGNTPDKMNQIDVRLPNGSNSKDTAGNDYTIPAFNLPGAASGQGLYYWVYLRRPANPFDTARPNQTRPNREMVVVDCIRMPVIDTGDPTTAPTGTPPSMSNTGQSPNIAYSAGRLQPYRGGHLVAPNTDPRIPYGAALTDVPTTPANANANVPANNAAAFVTTICPPSPPYAYGYSEQMAVPPTGNGNGAIEDTGSSNRQVTKKYQQSINDNNGNVDSNWTHFPFFDRDFNNVAELLLVPSCPPGLFTKQFVEEPYPGNIVNTAVTNTLGANSTTPVALHPTATGTDNGTGAFTYTTTPLPSTGGGNNNTNNNPAQSPGNNTNATGGNSTIVPPANPKTTTNADPTLAGRPNFNAPAVPNTNPPIYLPTPTFPCLSDNFYYTAASVGIPGTNAGISNYYQHLTTEIGGWTGAGWHKMLEFVEVPSSANGATGFASNGDNYDWYRADTKPGLLNLNLIIDDEVFAGLVDDPRLNETLAAYEIYNNTTKQVTAASAIPYVVSQIDPTTFLPSGAYPMFATLSTNWSQSPPQNTSHGELLNDPTLTYQLRTREQAGRGYTVRETNLAFNNLDPTTYKPGVPTLVHGLKAAFSDFLKLRQGGSGYLYAHGAGDVGMGDFTSLGAYTGVTAIAADRPYRSLSYPDINYTIMRPATLPPTPANGPTTNNPFFSPGTSPQLPLGLGGLYGYAADSKGGVPYVELVVGNSATAVPAPTNASGNFNGVAPLNQFTPGANSGPPTMTGYQYIQDPGIKNPLLSVQYANIYAALTSQPDFRPPGQNGRPTTDILRPLDARRLAPPYEARVTIPATAAPTAAGQAANYVVPIAAPFPAPIPPTPQRRLFEIPDRGNSASAAFVPSNASIVPSNLTAANAQANYYGSTDASTQTTVPANSYLQTYLVNQPAVTPQLSTGLAAQAVVTSGFAAGTVSTQFSPPTLFLETRSGFAPDNQTTQPANTFYNYLGAGPISGPAVANDLRQHPLYRTELLQKISNLTTVRTHQFAVWITIGLFEVIKVGTPELGIADVLGGEFGSAGDRTRYRSFFVIDRTKATGFNPYYPGNFRDCVTYRRRIE